MVRMFVYIVFLFFFKQKTAYEMRISDWSSDVCSSDLIAGVVNPPAAGKYQYWTGDSRAASFDAFVESATEHPGSWWPHWLAWLEAQDGARVAVKGRRIPGSKGDPVIEDAPGRYVKAR